MRVTRGSDTIKRVLGDSFANIRNKEQSHNWSESSVMVSKAKRIIRDG
jgi:hypothetical protein